MDRGFVLTDERLATNVPGVYAVGDIVPGLQLAHRGYQQGIYVAEQIAGLNPALIEDVNIPKVTYCDPEIASVGLTEAKAAEKYGAENVVSYEYNLAGNAKSSILGTAGSVKAVRVKEGPVAVSYTHLDVYKRQESSFSETCLSTCARNSRVCSRNSSVVKISPVAAMTLSSANLSLIHI